MTSIPPPGFDVAPEPPQNDPFAAPPAVPARPEGSAGWPPWASLAALITGFGVTVLTAVVVSVAALAFGASLEDPPPGVSITLTLFQNLSLVAAAYLFARLAGRPAAEDFGLRRTSIAVAIGLLLAVWVGFYALSAVWVTALGLDEKQTLPEELGADGSALNLALVIVLITVVAPLGEELFFRGFFFAALRNWKGYVLAAIITGLVFGAIHIGSSPIGFTVPLAFFGFGLCMLYQWTGSLYPCIALHALNNSVALGAVQKWGVAEIVPTMIGATAASLTIAWLLARALGHRAAQAASAFGQPAP